MVEFSLSYLIIQSAIREIGMKLLILIVSLLAVVSCQKLIMINQLFRHGARYPVYPRNDDYSNYTYTEHSFGQLTPNGKKMHYSLGQQLYKQYWDKLFKGTPYEQRYNQSKFYIKSTDVNRTIESVQSHMMGIFQNLTVLYIPQNMTKYSVPQWVGVTQPQQGPVFTNAPKFHPMAIHVQKTGTQPSNNGDFLRTYSPQNCPNQEIWKDQNRQSLLVKQIVANENFNLALRALSDQFKREISFWQAPEYYDNYECAKYMGKQFSNIFEKPEYRLALDYIHTLDMYINLYANPRQIRATSTGFFNQTLLNIKKIIQNKQQVQWNIYSAHDTTVGNMLIALNLTNVECIYDAFLKNITKSTDTCISTYPLYTSNLIFQILQYTNKTSKNEQKTTHTIKIRYNGEYRKIPFCDWKLECPVEAYYEWFDQFKDLNFLSTCGVKDQNTQLYFSIAAAQFIILLAVGLATLVSCLKKGMNKNKSPNNSKGNSSSPSFTKVEGQSNPMKQSLLTEQEEMLKQK